jgi:hypothetical protein
MVQIRIIEINTPIYDESATDPPSLRYGATSAVALQLKNAHNLCVSEFQFGGDSSMLFV